jgi:hypothetical protein
VGEIMLFALPKFENGKCLLQFINTRTEPVVLKRIVIRREPFVGIAVPQILKANLLIPADQKIEYDITAALIDHVAASTPEERTTDLHFYISYQPKDDQPDVLYRVVSRGKNIVEFSSR